MPKKPKAKASKENKENVGKRVAVLSHKLKRKVKKEIQQDQHRATQTRPEKAHKTFEQAAVPKPKTSASKVGWEFCLSGHPLHLFRTPHDEYVCDACNSDFLPQGTVMFGCRLCDWDACEKCAAESVQQRELLLESSAEKASAKLKAKISKEGSWTMLRGMDKYKNEYMYLRHEGSGICVELPHYSLAQFEYRPGPGAPGKCCSADGVVAPFQLTLPDLEAKLAQGKGKLIPEKKSSLGNWEVVGLGDGSAVAINTCKYVKTTKHKEGKVDAPSNANTAGLEVHFTPTGSVVWVCPEGRGEEALIIDPLVPARIVKRDEALKLLQNDDDGGDDEEDET